MQLEKGLVILEATASMESFRESSATVTSHACVYVRSCVRICMYVHMCAYVSKVYVHSATTVMTAHPSHMFVCISMYIRMCARWHASAFACVCATLTGASCPCFSSWWRQTYAVIRLCFVLVWSAAARVAAGGFARSPMWIPGGSWLLGTRLVDIMPCV